MQPLLVILSFLMFFIGCSKEVNVISVSLNPREAFSSLDPLAIQYTNEFYLLENLTTRLVSFDENGEHQLELASSINKISEYEYDFKIRKTSFSNGDLVTLKDVKHTIERSLLGTSHTNLKDYISEIHLSDDILKIKLKKASKSFFYYLSLPDLGILHPSQYSKKTLLAGDFAKISSGPFYYKTDGSSFSLLKNKHYTLGLVNYPDEIRLRNPFSENSISLLKSGELDLGQVSVKDFLSDRTLNDNLRVIGVPSDSLTYLYFNENAKGFKDEKHRLWLKKLILEHFNVPKAFNQFARRSIQYFPPESKAYLPERQVDSIVRSNLPARIPEDFPKKVTIHTYSTVYNVTIEDLVRRLENIPDFKVEIKNDIKPADYINKMKAGEFEIFLNIMSTDFRTPVEAINFEFFSTDSVLKDKDGSVKENFERFQEAQDGIEEVKRLQEISKTILLSDQIIPLFHSAIPFVYNSDKVDLSDLNHLFILNFWKIKSSR